MRWALHAGLVVAMLGCEETSENRRRPWFDYKPQSEVLVYCVDSREPSNGRLEAAVAHARSVNAGLMGFVVIEDGQVRSVPEDVRDTQAALDDLARKRGDIVRHEGDALESGFSRALVMANRSPSVSRRILYIGNGRLDGGMSGQVIVAGTVLRNFARVPIDVLVDEPAAMGAESASMLESIAKQSGGVLVSK